MPSISIPSIVLPEVAVEAAAPEVLAATLPEVIAPELALGGALAAGAVGLGAADIASLGGSVTDLANADLSAVGVDSSGTVAPGSPAYQVLAPIAEGTATPQSLSDVFNLLGVNLGGGSADPAAAAADLGISPSDAIGAGLVAPPPPVPGTIGLPPVDVTAAAPDVASAGAGDVAAAAAPDIAPITTPVAAAPPPAPPPPPPPPALESPSMLSSLLNSINPISPAEAAQPMVNIPGLGNVPQINVPSLEPVDPSGGAAVGGPGSTSAPGGVSSPGAGAGGTPSSQLTGNLQPGGAISNAVSGITPTPAAPGQAPPELTGLDTSGASTSGAGGVDTSGATAGTSAAPPSAPASAVGGPASTATDTSATATGIGTPTGTTAGTPTGAVGGDTANVAGTQAAPLDTSSQAGASDVGGASTKSGGVLGFLKDNASLLSLAGTAGGLLMSLFNKPGFPTEKAATAATQAGQTASQDVGLPAALAALEAAKGAVPVAQSAVTNATAAQTPAQLAARNAAQLLVPTSEAGVSTAATTAGPIAQTQSDLSTQTAASAQPLLEAATTGLLPPGEADAIQQALDTSRATIEGTYGNLNLGGSTTEAQDIAAAAGNIRGQIPSILNTLVTQGIQEATSSGGSANQSLNAINTILSSISGLGQSIGTETGAAGGVTSAAGGVTQASGNLTGAAGGETSAASGVTGAVNAITNAGQAASNANLQVAQLQLQADQELQTALASLGRNLALSQISPSTINVTG